MRKGTKQLALVKAHGADGTPDDEQLALVNRYTLRAHTADEVVVRTFVIARSGIDRDKEVIDVALLRDFARTLPGKGLFVKHPQSWEQAAAANAGLIMVS